MEKEIILEKISQSRDESPGKGKCFHIGSSLHHIGYSDIMDIVLYYISLQDDLDEIAKISKHDFSYLVERVLRQWIKERAEQWGKQKTARF